MASIYQRKDSGLFWLSCYPKQGGPLVRVSLGTEDRDRAEAIHRKVELLEGIERLGDVPIPASLLTRFGALTTHAGNGAEKAQGGQNPEKKEISKPQQKNELREAIRSYLVRSATTNVASALNDKIYRLRKFFGSKLIDELDPRPAERRRHARKRVIEPWFKGSSLGEITPDTTLSFFLVHDYGRSNKRHFREVFHGLFKYALVNGLYRPENPYAPNPADQTPSFSGRDEKVTLLASDDVLKQYEAVTTDRQILFGCRLMIEGGFRCHEILSLRRAHIASDHTSISLTMPERLHHLETGLKTGERSVTIRHVLLPHITEYLSTLKSDWLFVSPREKRLSTNAFGDALRQCNRTAKLPWTTQDFRHTFATNRIREGWNLKTLADEMGTSIQMLMSHYPGYIAPPVHAALASATSSH